VAASGAATADGAPVDSLALDRAVRAHVTRHPGGAVHFDAARDLPYADYIRVLDTIKAAFLAERDRAARGKFKRPYDELPDDERAVIQRVVPLRITLREPTPGG
jgi:hypothetical protein